MVLEKIETQTARAGVIGLGYVGMPLMVAIANAGFRVTGIDICSEKIARLKQGISDVPDVTNTMLASLITSGQIQVTTDFSVLQELDTVNICVPTPLGENRTPDLQFIIAAVEQIAQHLHPETADYPRKHHLSRHNRRSLVAETQRPFQWKHILRH